MRIPNEEQLFTVGDKALYKNKLVTISGVQEQTVYYEHRPIATYLAYVYIITDSTEKKYYVETSDLLICEQ